MTVGTIAEWSVEVGDEVGAGDVFCEIETDKATVSFECQDDCFIAKILVEPGTEISTGTPVMVTVTDEDDVAAFADFVAPAAAVAAPAAAPAPAPAAAAPAPAPAAASTAAPVAPAPVGGAWYGNKKFA